MQLLVCSVARRAPPLHRPRPSPPQYERVVNKSFDDTWTSLIDYTSQALFGIDRFEKASGLMTLNFGSSEPARFIDCGQMKAQAAAQSIDMPYAKYLNERFGAKLDGKMNLVVRSVDPKRTLVRVNARYIFIAPAQTQPQTPAQTWTFDSGGGNSNCRRSARWHDPDSHVPTHLCGRTSSSRRRFQVVGGKVPNHAMGITRDL